MAHLDNFHEAKSEGNCPMMTFTWLFHIDNILRLNTDRKEITCGIFLVNVWLLKSNNECCIDFIHRLKGKPAKCLPTMIVYICLKFLRLKILLV